MPSSLTRVLSYALAFSANPPVSVCGTVICKLKLRGFSWKLGINHFMGLKPSTSCLSVSRKADLPTFPAYTLIPRYPTLG